MVLNKRRIVTGNRQRKAIVRKTGTKSPTKANTDRHNGDLK